VDLVDDLPARKQNTTGQLASQLLTELANITAARARRADSAARELNRPPPSTRWTRDLTTQAAALDRTAAHRTVATDQARAGAADNPTIDDPATPHLNQHQPATAAGAQQNALAGQDLTEARAAIAAVNTLPARRPAPVGPTGPAGHRPPPTRSAQPTSRPPSR